MVRGLGQTVNTKNAVSALLIGKAYTTVRSTSLMWTQRVPYLAFFQHMLILFFLFLFWFRLHSNLIYSQGWSWICDHTRISGLIHHARLKPVLYDKNSIYFTKWRLPVSGIISPETWADLLHSTVLRQKPLPFPCICQHCCLLSDNSNSYEI